MSNFKLQFQVQQILLDVAVALDRIKQKDISYNNGDFSEDFETYVFVCNLISEEVDNFNYLDTYETEEEFEEFKHEEVESSVNELVGYINSTINTGHYWATARFNECYPGRIDLFIAIDAIILKG